MASDNCVHRAVPGAPISTCRFKMSTLMPYMVGSKPSTVTPAVSSTGRRRMAPVRMIASIGS